MKNSISVLFLLSLFFTSSIYATEKPNIVVILVDDAGNNDWGFQGSQIMANYSPSLDQLAGEGTIFTQGYVTQSVCAPSRAGMLSGQYQEKLGFDHNIVTYVNAPGHDHNDVGLNAHVPTMGNYLKELGYSTSLFGKWHIGEEEHHLPENRGFDHFYGLYGGSRNYNVRETSHDKVLHYNKTLAEPKDNNFYLTDLLTDSALVYMEREITAGNPFLAFMSYTAPHGPFQAKPEDKAIFENVLKPNGTALSENQKNYYGMCKNVDDNVGRIVEMLKEKGEYENTLFVFLSDNGGVSLTNNGALRGNKSSQYEGGLRVPFFVTWKQGVPSNQKYDHQVISLDLLTTFIKAAGGDLKDRKYQELDGQDLVTAANNLNNPIHDALFWRKEFTWGVVSDGTNKIIFDAGKELLVNQQYDTIMYNLANDISEKNDVYVDNKAEVAPLVEAYEQWYETLEMPSWIGKSYILKRICGGGSICDSLRSKYEYFQARNRLTMVKHEEVNLTSTEDFYLSSSIIDYQDALNGPNLINYVLSELPQYGDLYLEGKKLSTGDYFTQEEVNLGLIKYTYTADHNLPDRFNFEINDSYGGEVIPDQTLSINFGFYTIEYEVGEGENALENPSTYQKTDDDIILAPAHQEGFIFEGWFIDENFTEEIKTITKGTTGNLVLFAKFTKVVTSISDDLGVISEMELYPNPSKGLVNIEFETDGRREVTIHNAMGDIVYQDMLVSEKRIEFQLHQPKGVYFITVKYHGSTEIGKLILN
ncbi:sulfatase-like hydrolase/transferase [Flammeovirga aprica]|uniref:Sulfatase-like hydrolase/transferase n=1 Tax=Flammeovirga aprica JL-4 TaxID=694437 RepID=A0A7X9RUL0_9BACT|nr:sulfatase-like hydrolase/transferase [Flammeovirga aprica]NME68993.1 sulfatase-like hydrolase/transferase [Flammeovirga aprica JL-4]